VDAHCCEGGWDDSIDDGLEFHPGVGGRVLGRNEGGTREVWELHGPPGATLDVTGLSSPERERSTIRGLVADPSTAT